MQTFFFFKRAKEFSSSQHVFSVHVITLWHRLMVVITLWQRKGTSQIMYSNPSPNAEMLFISPWQMLLLEHFQGLEGQSLVE